MSLLFDEKPGTNAPALSVSELSNRLKKTVEDSFGLVRVRGEISQPKLATSGHWYLALKDQDAVMDAVCWRGSAQKLAVKPAEGLDVVCTGRLTTYPGRSKYQMVIDSMALAGEGALLKMLEERKKRLLAEGIFDPSRKKALPFLPRIIGVVTSPTGAVIRDILHRLSDRFPCHVIVWPVLVQGDGAAAQVTAAIEGFNRLLAETSIPRPDLLIIARGGGSIEDLMAFNEENVVRAAAASQIPLISAIGHETDTTLIDLAADMRAPTPTAAAEMAVPVRIDLWRQIQDMGRRQHIGWQRLDQHTCLRLDMAAQKLAVGQRMTEKATQRLDLAGDRLGRVMANVLEVRHHQLEKTHARLPSPRQHWQVKVHHARQMAERLDTSLHQRLKSGGRDHLALAGRWQDLRIQPRIAEAGQKTRSLFDRAGLAVPRMIDRQHERLTALAQRLENVSHHAVLARGYALIRDSGGQALVRAQQVMDAESVIIEMADGKVKVEIA